MSFHLALHVATIHVSNTYDYLYTLKNYRLKTTQLGLFGNPALSK